MKLLRKILIPVVPVYYGITWIRNFCYDTSILPSKSYDFPIICVGNINVGGTGKTPMIEYLIKLLKDDYFLATLSRGYGRRTKGFVICDKRANASIIGDEPFQFYQKFKEIIVAVGEDRQDAIDNLLQLPKTPDVLLLDDGFQHRKVNAGLKILLTSYTDLYVHDMLLPAGDLREPISGVKRADIIIVTKCPQNLTDEDRRKIITKLTIKSHQNIFFSSITYGNTLLSKNQNISIDSLVKNKFTLVTGIANPKPLVKYLNENQLDFTHKVFKDHHNFSNSEIKELNNQKLILTTEKDYMRLKDKINKEKLFYLPISINIMNSNNFDLIIRSFIEKF